MRLALQLHHSSLCLLGSLKVGLNMELKLEVDTEVHAWDRATSKRIWIRQGLHVRQPGGQGSGLMGVGMRRRRVILKSADLLLQRLLLFYFKQHTAPGATANTAIIRDYSCS